ncbi:MAG: rhomboid family intramembrane serine protease [Polyangia bacterium]
MDPTAPATSASLRDRLLAALANPGAGHTADRATLMAVQDHLAVLEWPDEGKGLVVLDHAGTSPESFRAAVDRVLQAHQAGLLFLVAVGGGDQAQAALADADRDAHNQDHLGVYQLTDDGRLLRVAGRRLAPLESAVERLGQAQALTPDEISEIIERGRRERVEASAFAQAVSKRSPRITFALIAACFLVFAFLDGSGAQGAAVKAWLSDGSREVWQGEIWRVFTYAFLHANTTHLLVNMLALYSLGGFLEALLGGRRYLAVYCASAVGGGIATALAGALRAMMGGPPSYTVGASGAIWGLMGATLALVLGRRRALPRLIARGLRQRLLVVLVINVALSFLPGIDLYAHFGGGLVGFLLTRSDRFSRPAN